MEYNVKKLFAYIGLFFVVFVWGSVPLFTLELYQYYSPTFRVFFSESVVVIVYLLMSGKNIKRFNFEYIKIGAITGFFVAAANISQKIGLLYTTPAKYAFLENLSCITVPVLMYILVKKKISFFNAIAAVTCLASVFVLNNVSRGGTSWGKGEILCAVSGLLYGFNIAGTGVYAKKLYTPLYLAVQSTVGATVALICSLILNNITVTSSSGVSAPVEKIVFSTDPRHLLFSIAVAVISCALCWTIRTESMKYIDAGTVAIIMPFSAVITGVISVITGKDILSMNLLVGGILGLIAIILSEGDSIFKKKV